MLGAGRNQAAEKLLDYSNKIFIPVMLCPVLVNLGTLQHGAITILSLAKAHSFISDIHMLLSKSEFEAGLLTGGN